MSAVARAPRPSALGLMKPQRIVSDEPEHREQRLASELRIRAKPFQSLLVRPAPFGIALADPAPVLLRHGRGDLLENAATLPGIGFQYGLAVLSGNDRRERIRKPEGIEQAAREAEPANGVDDMSRIPREEHPADSKTLGAAVVDSVGRDGLGC